MPSAHAKQQSEENMSSFVNTFRVAQHSQNFNQALANTDGRERNGTASAADLQDVGDLWTPTLNVDGFDGKLTSLIDWLQLNHVDVLALPEAELKTCSQHSVFDEFK